MNLSDLRDELTAHADDLGTAGDFSPGVAGRVRATKRRRAVAAGSLATLAVAALTVGVLPSLGRPAPILPAGSPSSAAPMVGADGMPFRSVPDAPGDIVKDGLRYRAAVAGDTLAAGFIGDRGQGQFSLLWEPTTTHVSVGAQCWLPGLTGDEAATYMVTVSLAGSRGFFGGSCSAGRPAERDLPARGTVPGEPGQGWTELTVGRAASVSIQLVDAKTNQPASVDGAQLTGAVYELGSQTTVKDLSGTPVAALPHIVEHQGYRYRLERLSTSPLRSGRLSPTGAPAGPAVVLWGSAGDTVLATTPGSPSSLRLDGLRNTGESRPVGSWGPTPVPAGSARTLSLVAEGPRPNSGTAFIAVYTLER
jgi:hypothetical protein